MYIVIYYITNLEKSATFNTLTEAYRFWEKLPFESFCELYKEDYEKLLVMY